MIDAIDLNSIDVIKGSDIKSACIRNEHIVVINNIIALDQLHMSNIELVLLRLTKQHAFSQQVIWIDKLNECILICVIPKFCVRKHYFVLDCIGSYFE